MAAQVRKRAVVVQAGRLLQLVKHADEALGRKSALGHYAEPDPISLTLHFARKVQLVLHGKRLPARQHRIRRIRILARCQHPQDHRADQPGSLFALLGYEPRNMALRDMAHLVRQH